MCCVKLKIILQITDALGFYDTMNYMVEPGDFVFMVGGNVVMMLQQITYN